MCRIAFAVCAVSACLISHVSFAETFNTQVGAGYTRVDYGRYDTGAYNLRAVYFFEPVKREQGPLDEASFLSPSSSLEANASRAHGDSSLASNRESQYGLVYRFASRQSPWTASVHLDRLESELTVSAGSQGHGSGPSTVSPAMNRVGFSVGAYATEKTHVQLSYRHYSYENVSAGADDEVSIDAKHVVLLSDGQALSILASIDRTLGGEFDLVGTTPAINASYYFTHASSVGVGYTRFYQEGGGPNFSNHTWSLNAAMFFAERYRLGAALVWDDLEGFKSNLVSLTFEARF